MSNIYKRLNEIIPKIKEPDFILGRGLGNDISFYIFDYDPQDELIVRNHIEFMKKEFSFEGFNRKIIEFDLYKMLLEAAKKMRIFDQMFEKEKLEGKEETYQAISEFAVPETFLEMIKEKVTDHNLIFITGIGKVYPFVRSHTILNNLQEVVDLPVIMFYPGKYDGQALHLFGVQKDDNYYRAFPLVDKIGGSYDY